MSGAAIELNAAGGASQGWLRSRADIVFLLLILLLLFLHPRGWADSPPDVDPINFKLALQSYELAADRPHPPGYPLYVALARGASHAVSADHAYALVNLVLLCIALTALYFTLRSQHRPVLGVVLAALLASHPLVLAVTVVPESYVADMAFSSVVFAVTWGLRLTPRVLAVMLVLVFFGFGLFRFVSTVLLAPLALCNTWYATEPSQRSRAMGLVGGAVLIGAGLAYLVTVQAAGGVTTYAIAAERVMGQSFRGMSVLGGASWSTHAASAVKLVVWLCLLLSPAVAIWIAAKVGAVHRMSRNQGPFGSKWILLAWVAPAFAFYLLIYYLKPAYQLIYLVPLLAFPLSHIDDASKGGRRLLSVAAGLVCAMQLAVFTSDGDSLPEPIYRLTHRFIEDRDLLNARLAKAIAGSESSNGALIVWDGSSDVPIQHLRLAVGDKPIAAYLPRSGVVQFWNPYSATWGEPAQAPGRFQCALVLKAREGTVSMRRLAFDTPNVTWAQLAMQLQQAMAAASGNDDARCSPAPPRGVAS